MTLIDFQRCVIHMQETKGGRYFEHAFDCHVFHEVPPQSMGKEVDKPVRERVLRGRTFH